MSLRRFVEPPMVTAPIVLLIAVATVPDVGAIVNAAATACRQALPARWRHHRRSHRPGDSRRRHDGRRRSRDRRP